MKSKQIIIDTTQKCSWGFLTFTHILLVLSFKDELTLGTDLSLVVFLKMTVSS